MKHDPKAADLFDRSRLRLRPIAQRRNKLDLSILRKLVPVEVTTPAFAEVGRSIVEASARGASVILILGAHVIRAGVQRYLIDLMERGLVSCVALNGAGLIHDYELALIGATTEDVESYLAEGQFGLWRETGRINEIAAAAAREGLGLGQVAGRTIETGDFPHKSVSLLAAGHRLGVPVTVHVGIGYDIIYEHPNCNGGAWGESSYCDFLRFARVVESLEGGVVGTFGSAVMAPEVFLKSLAMARNVARSDGRRITDFDSLVCDLLPLPAEHRDEPKPDDPAYFFRPWKTLLIRSVSGGGRSHYVRGHHGHTLPELWSAIELASAEVER